MHISVTTELHDDVNVITKVTESHQCDRSGIYAYYCDYITIATAASVWLVWLRGYIATRVWSQVISPTPISEITDVI